MSDACCGPEDAEAPSASRLRNVHEMGDDLRRLPNTFAHARRASRIMHQNLALSGAILVVLVPLAASASCASPQWSPSTSWPRSW